MENELDSYKKVKELNSDWKNLKQEEESEMEKATSEAVFYTEDGKHPDGDNTKEYECNPDDNSEEEFNPGMVSSPVGT